MVLSMIGIIIGLVFLIVMVMKGWPLMIVGALASMIVAAFSGVNVISGYLETYMGGMGGFLIGQIPIFLWGAIFGECYGVTGGAKSLAQWIAKIFKGKKENAVLSPLVTIVIVFLAGLLLSYGINTGTLPRIQNSTVYGTWYDSWMYCNCSIIHAWFTTGTERYGYRYSWCILYVSSSAWFYCRCSDFSIKRYLSEFCS